MHVKSMKAIWFYIVIYIGYNLTDTDKKHTERASRYLTVQPLFTCAPVTLYFNIYISFHHFQTKQVTLQLQR